MKKALAVSAILIITALLAMLLIGYDAMQTGRDTTAYVGVAYCGNSVAEGKMLIDRVKGCSNLFVLQSGQLQRNLASVDDWETTPSPPDYTSSRTSAPTSKPHSQTGLRQPKRSGETTSSAFTTATKQAEKCLTAT